MNKWVHKVRIGNKLCKGLAVFRRKTMSHSKGDYFQTDHLMLTLKERALRGASITVIAQACVFAIQTIGTIILARLLIPSDFGLITMVLSVALLLGNFGTNGLTEAVIQAKEINHEQLSTLFWINIGINIVLALLFILLAPVIVWFYREPRLTSIIIAIAVSNVIGALSVQHLSLLKRRMKFPAISAIDVIASIVSVTVPIILAKCDWGYWALVSKWVIYPLMITTCAWIMCGWRPGLPSMHAGIGPMLRFSFHAYGNFIISYLRRNVDKMVIGRSYGSQPLGCYDRAYHLSSLIPSQIVGPLNSVAISTFSRISEDSKKYCHSYIKVISILAFVGMPLSAASVLISDDVVLLVLGAQWKEAGNLFFAFGLSMGISIIYATHNWLHLSLGTPDRWFRWSIVELFVTVLCFLVAIPYGPLGIAIGFSASFYILIGPGLWYAGKPVNLKISYVLSGIWKYYMSALCSGILCWFILYYFDQTAKIIRDLNIIARIIASTTTCIFFYLVIIVIFFQGVKPISEFIFFLHEIIAKKNSNR
jgi:O-antigen/teichoic acid export membrane protein